GVSVTSGKTLNIQGIISGTSGFTKSGEGTVILSNINTYSGETILQAGTLQIGSDQNLSTSGSTLTLNGGTLRCQSTNMTSPAIYLQRNCIINSNSTIEVEQVSTTYIYGQFSGSGTLTKTGRGSLTIPLSSNFTGNTSVQDGQLYITGRYPSPEIDIRRPGRFRNEGAVESSESTINYGTVCGTGKFTYTAGSGFLNRNGGYLQAGSSPFGTLTIEGPVTLESNSFVTIETNFITMNILKILSGTLTIGSDVNLNIILDKPDDNEDWRDVLIDDFASLFLDAETITGDFAGFVCPYPGFTFSIVENGEDYTLHIDTLPLASLVSDPNQKTVANIFDQNYSSQSPDFIEANMELYFLELPALKTALNELHPALFNGIALAQEETTSYIAKVLSQRLEEITWKNPNLKERKWNIWGQGIRDYARQKGKSNLRGYHATTPGVIIGTDVKILSNFALGFQGSYTNTHIGWEAHQGYGHTTTGYGGLYGSWYNDYLLVGLSLLGGWNSSKATRSIDFGEIERKSHHRQHGWEIAPQLEIGGLYEMKYISLQPFVKENYVYLHQNHYREHGAESLNLDVKEKNADLLRSEIGLGLFHCFKGNELQFTPELKGSYILESRFQGKKTTAYFLNDTVIPFTVKGLSPSRSLGHIGILLKGSSYNGFDLTLDYNFQFGKKYQDHKMTLRLGYAF
ncbi:MAG: autotransporter domain-containing protein, partial [Chlamydiota bacterium]